MKSSHCPKYERNTWKNLPWILRAEFFKFFRSYFGQWDVFIFSFWNLLTFRILNFVFLFFSQKIRNATQKAIISLQVMTPCQTHIYIFPCHEKDAYQLNSRAAGILNILVGTSLLYVVGIIWTPGWNTLNLSVKTWWGLVPTSPNSIHSGSPEPKFIFSW